MNTSFSRVLEDDKGHKTLAVLDCIEQGDCRVWLSRINVPVSHRGKGVARTLMNRLLKEADENGIEINLTINPTGRPGVDPGYSELADWYRRVGFKDTGVEGYFIRQPVPDGGSSVSEAQVVSGTWSTGNVNPGRS